MMRYATMVDWLISIQKGTQLIKIILFLSLALFNLYAKTIKLLPEYILLRVLFVLPLYSRGLSRRYSRYDWAEHPLCYLLSELPKEKIPFVVGSA